MSNDILPFQQAQVPSFLANTGMTPEQVKAMNAAAALGTGGAGLNKISFKQSRFRMVVGGAETIIPSLELDLVIVRVNEGISKTWYEKDWNPNDEPGAPECSSDDGIRPRADAEKPQCGPDGLCANCPQNQWGSKVNKMTGAKIKACTDTKRMAIMPPGHDGRYTNTAQDLFQVSIPPASLGDFGGFVRNLASMPTPAGYNMVVATLSFDSTVSYPKILVKPKRWLEQDEWAVIKARFDDEETKRIAGIASAQTMRLAAPTAQQPVQQQPVQQQPVQQQPVQQQPVQQQPVQQQPVQQQPVQQQPVQQQPVQQQPVQQAAGGWGQPAQQATQHQQPVQQQPVQQQAAGGWGDVAPQQVQQQAYQNAPQQRERGKAAPGKTRRTKAEIEEDRLADERDAQAAGGQHQQPVQQQPVQQQAAGGWGDVAPQQVQQQPVQQQAAGGWGEQPVQQQPVQQQQMAPVDASNPWAGAQQAQQPAQGAPVQPNVMPGAENAFAGWDD